MSRRRLHPKLRTSEHIPAYATCRRWVVHDGALKDALLVFEVTLLFETRSFSGFKRTRQKSNGNWKRSPLTAVEIETARALIPAEQITEVMRHLILRGSNQ